MKYLALGLVVACAGDGRVSSTRQAVCYPGGESDCCGSPIIIDLAGDGAKVTSKYDGVLFQLRPGTVRKYAWTEPGSDDAFLAMDLNGNGTIDDGTELFGNFTPQRELPGEYKNGFVALRDLDVNNSGVVDANDFEFERLRLWTDKNHDGVSQTDELVDLASAGIVGLSTNYWTTDWTSARYVDEHGNLFAFEANVYSAKDSGVGRLAVDVYLTAGALATAGAGKAIGLVAPDGEPCFDGNPPPNCSLACPGPSCNPPQCVKCPTLAPGPCQDFCSGFETCTDVNGCQNGPMPCSTPP